MVKPEGVVEAFGFDGAGGAMGFCDQDVDVHVPSWDGKEHVNGQVGARSLGFPGF